VTKLAQGPYEAQAPTERTVLSELPVPVEVQVVPRIVGISTVVALIVDALNDMHRPRWFHRRVPL